MIISPQSYFSRDFCSDFALFGFPIGHSISPEIHQALFALHGADFRYVSVEMPPDQFHHAIDIVGTKLRGFNCTIPHKSEILSHLDTISPVARAMGAVNTVFYQDHSLVGYNTDIDGFAQTLAMDGVSLTGKQVLILGCGGVSRMMAFYAISQQAHVTLCARNQTKAAALAQSLASNMSITAFDTVSGQFDVVLNGTPVGMWPNEDASPLDLSKIHGVSYVFDTIYNPPRTQLLLQAQQLGIQARNGLAMLVLQAAQAQSIWTGLQFSSQQNQAAVLAGSHILAKRRLHDHQKTKNLILIGFMGCGKTTVGKILARNLQMQFLDLDDLIQQQCGMSIPQFFASKGEAAFRALESKLCAQLPQLENTVIATGGGVVTNAQNVSCLQQAGFVVCLLPSFAFLLRNLQNDTSRPLLQNDPQRIRTRQLLEQRLPLYRNAAHTIIEEEGTPEQRAMAVELAI